MGTLFYLVTLAVTISFIIKLITKLMATLTDFQAQIATIDTSLTEIGAEITTLQSQLTGTLSAADSETVLAGLADIASKLSAMIPAKA